MDLPGDAFLPRDLGQKGERRRVGVGAAVDAGANSQFQPAMAGRPCIGVRGGMAHAQGQPDCGAMPKAAPRALRDPISSCTAVTLPRTSVRTSSAKRAALSR